jgi:hypothetical protein
MAVLIEAISVVVRRDVIERKFKGGWAAFVASVPNATLCADDKLARVGFMSPSDVEAFVHNLEHAGLTFQSGEMAIDFAVVDQVRGPTSDCAWLEFGQFAFGNSGGKVSAAWLFDELRIDSGIHFPGHSPDLATPDGWTYEGSLSERFTFVEGSAENAKLKFLRSEGSIDVFLDLATGREIYRGRKTNVDNPSVPERGSAAVSRDQQGKHLLHVSPDTDFVSVMLSLSSVFANELSSDKKRLFSKWARLPRLRWDERHVKHFATAYVNYLYDLKSRMPAIPENIKKIVAPLPEPNPLPRTDQPTAQIRRLFDSMLGIGQ